MYSNEFLTSNMQIAMEILLNNFISEENHISFSSPTKQNISK